MAKGTSFVNVNGTLLIVLWWSAFNYHSTANKELNEMVSDWMCPEIELIKPPWFEELW